MRLSRSSLATSLASAARQLEYALARSMSPTEAFQKLHALADERQGAVLRELEALLNSPVAGEPKDLSSRAASFESLGWLLRQTADPDHCAAALLEAYRRRAAYSSATATIIWTEFAGFLAYLGAVLAILLCVVGVYGMFELPNFRAMYLSFGDRLPSLTAGVFGRGAPVLTAFVLCTAMLLAVLSFFVFSLRRQLRRFAPMASSWERLPLIGSVVRSYHEYLWLSYASLLRATGKPSAQALALGAERVPFIDSPDWDAPPTKVSRAGGCMVAADLQLAAHLGRLDDEATFQQDATADAFLEALARCRRRSRLILTIAVYWLVATYVTAMYLPIFSLGSEL